MGSDDLSHDKGCFISFESGIATEILIFEETTLLIKLNKIKKS